MSDHDALCCDLIAKARADERERIARAIDAAIQGIWNGMDFGLLKAARIARGEHH